MLRRPRRRHHVMTPVKPLDVLKDVKLVPGAGLGKPFTAPTPPRELADNEVYAYIEGKWEIAKVARKIMGYVEAVKGFEMVHCLPKAQFDARFEYTWEGLPKWNNGTEESLWGLHARLVTLEGKRPIMDNLPAHYGKHKKPHTIVKL